MKKPDVLYHASVNNDIAVLDPKTSEERLSHYGNLLFATPYKALAAMFLAPKTQALEVTKFGDTFALVAASSAEEFIEKDLGGTIYTLPSDSFATHQDLTMQDTEYVTKESVTPIDKEVYATALDAMRRSGVRVYFVEASVLKDIRSADDHGLKILSELTPYF